MFIVCSIIYIEVAHESSLALWSVYPAVAADHAITCPRPVLAQYAMMAFDLQQLDIASGQGEIDHELELRFSMNTTIRQLDPARPGWVGPRRNCRRDRLLGLAGYRREELSGWPGKVHFSSLSPRRLILQMAVHSLRLC